MLALLPLAAALIGTARGYSFEFTSTPTQCEPLSLRLTGTGGVPPYNILILAYGNPPGGDERRKIISHDFTDTTTSFTLAWPANAQFIAMVSDANGVGTGGTTISVNAGVNKQNDSSCLPTNVQPTFFLIINDVTPNTIEQCTPVRLSWGHGTTGTGAVNPVSIYGVIPGGNSFSIDTSNANIPSNGTNPGITWTPNVPAFTDMILVAGDATGRGTGGSSGIINVADSGDKSCLQPNGPHSTAGTAAGGAYPTAATGSGSGTQVGPIVGGVIGGLAFVILVLLAVLFFCWRRRRQTARQSILEKPDLADGEPAAAPLSGGGTTRADLEPTPFIVPPSEFGGGLTGSHRGSAYDLASSSGAPTSWRPNSYGQTQEGGRPYSLVSTSAPRTSSDFLPASAEAARDRKWGPGGGPPLRPVNVIQHADAGAVDDEGQEPETVELPPAYGALRAGPSAPPPPAA